MIRSLVKRCILRLYEWRIINIGRARKAINFMRVNDA